MDFLWSILTCDLGGHYALGGDAGFRGVKGPRVGHSEAHLVVHLKPAKGLNVISRNIFMFLSLIGT